MASIVRRLQEVNVVAAQRNVKFLIIEASDELQISFSPQFLLFLNFYRSGELPARVCFVAQHKVNDFLSLV